MGDKRLAKRLALSLNNTLMQDGKKSKFADYTWNVKYLHRYVSVICVSRICAMPKFSSSQNVWISRLIKSFFSSGKIVVSYFNCPCAF